MNRILLFVALLAGITVLPACSMAEGLAKAAGRTTGTVSRSVSNLGSSLSR